MRGAGGDETVDAGHVGDAHAGLGGLQPLWKLAVAGEQAMPADRRVIFRDALAKHLFLDVLAGEPGGEQALEAVR